MEPEKKNGFSRTDQIADSLRLFFLPLTDKKWAKRITCVICAWSLPVSIQQSNFCTGFSVLSRITCTYTFIKYTHENIISLDLPTPHWTVILMAETTKNDMIVDRACPLVLSEVRQVLRYAPIEIHAYGTFSLPNARRIYGKTYVAQCGKQWRQSVAAV